jgi:creatinine amidohydrolase
MGVLALENMLFKLTRPEVEAYLKRCDVVLFPVGSTEQHGKHMAIDNDAFTALEISKRVAVNTGVLVAPVMPFGYSIHHMKFAGSITLKFDTLVAVYKEVCESLIHHGFKKIVIMNGHGGNINAVNQALREVRSDDGVIVYNVMVFPMESGFGSDSLKVCKQESGGHACEEETSIGLALGQRILIDKAEKWKPPKDTIEFDKKYWSKVTTARDFHEYTEIGSLGDPTIATREKGEEMVNAVVRDVTEFVEDLKKL